MEEEDATDAPGPDTTPAGSVEPPCRQLIDTACEHLGRHSEECLEARARLPRDVTPEWRLGCLALLETYVESELETNPCRLFERRVCADLGANTLACDKARSDASRLRRRRQTNVCLGDLLAWEARKLFSGRGAESGR